ncbi:MAG: hypothetical protein P9L97_05855 [Candidatus Tenebribacter davisii]|nr:hypothetical protein [Candidatus Tenebribacter davisii]
MEIGDYIKQEGRDFVAYGRITKQLKMEVFTHLFIPDMMEVQQGKRFRNPQKNGTLNL